MGDGAGGACGPWRAGIWPRCPSCSGPGGRGVCLMQWGPPGQAGLAPPFLPTALWRLSMAPDPQPGSPARGLCPSWAWESRGEWGSPTSCPYPRPLPPAGSTLALCWGLRTHMLGSSSEQSPGALNHGAVSGWGWLGGQEPRGGSYCVEVTSPTPGTAGPRTSPSGVCFSADFAGFPVAQLSPPARHAGLNRWAAPTDPQRLVVSGLALDSDCVDVLVEGSRRAVPMDRWGAGPNPDPFPGWDRPRADCTPYPLPTAVSSSARGLSVAS